MARKVSKKVASQPKKAEEKKAPSAKKPVLVKKGMARFQAKKDRAIHVAVGPKKSVRIGDKERVEVNLDVMSYSAFNILKRAVKDGDIMLLSGGK